MRSLLLVSFCVALPLGSALAADAIEVLADPAAVTGEVKEIRISKMKFDQPEIRVKTGSVVTWVNTEALPHNVHFLVDSSDKSKDIQGPMLRANQKYSVRFNQAGTYEYTCTPHPFMKAKVIAE
ncbi:amicyanin [Microvirga massiliensis]|uniref:amicyanin n=1 Tax=Microvirga massiliensis TaxID=1033741 RepID=UPI00062BE404|nr:amicyanin [Microvirga massiliensis]